MAAITHHNKGPSPGDFIEPTRQTPPPGFRGCYPQSPARPRCLCGPKSESTPSCGCPFRQMQAAGPAAAGSLGASAQAEPPALPQRPPGARGYTNGDAERVAEEGGGPVGDTHPPKQAAGGEGGSRERSGRRCRCRCCWPPASSPLFGFDRPRHSLPRDPDLPAPEGGATDCSARSLARPYLMSMRVSRWPPASEGGGSRSFCADVRGRAGCRGGSSGMEGWGCSTVKEGRPGC